MKRTLQSFVTVVALGLVMALAGCSGDDGSTGATGATGAPGSPGSPGAPGASGEVTNATCLSANCHGKANLVKTIVRNDAGKEGVVETIPLYVDNALFAATVHGGQRCVGCHSDINAAGGAHGPVAKTYGGWARFSAKQAVETIATNEFLRTRNYFTAASRSCATCHSNHAGFANSAHVTIYKQRSARVDTALREAVRVAFGDNAIVGEDFGENYTAGDCNRCHNSCATCHFKSTIKRAQAGNPLNFWDNNQAGVSTAISGWNDKMTEFEMDWTTNVVSHEIRRGSYFDNDAEGVCEACHTGLYKKAKTAYYWADAAKTIVKSVKATDVKRHPQAYELLISGDNTVLTGGNNTAHAAKTCAECHGGSKGDVHSLPGLPYEWDAPPPSPRGDVHCTDCHSATHTNPAVALHLDNTGTSVACVGCHAFGLARDFMFAYGAPVDNSTDVFLDPETNQVRPVVYKHTFAEAWYPHNWQTLNPGTGMTDPNGDCAKKCHYSGNAVGAP